jgi:hypothetical protein
MVRRAWHFFGRGSTPRGNVDLRAETYSDPRDFEADPCAAADDQNALAI